ncbi:MAG: zinc-binding dehydrogenase [Caldilineaceae bacterium]
MYELGRCAAWAAIHAGVKLGDVVAVNGVGFAGNILLQGAAKSGASKVIAIDVVPAKLRSHAALGAEHVIDARKVDPVEAVNEITKGEGRGRGHRGHRWNGIGIKQALGMVRHNGIISLYGDNYALVDSFCFHRFHEDGLEIRNSTPSTTPSCVPWKTCAKPTALWNGLRSRYRLPELCHLSAG